MAAMAVAAFSKALRLRISRGRMPVSAIASADVLPLDTPLLGRIDCRDGGTEGRHQTDGFHGDPPGVEGSCDTTTTRAWARRSNDGIGFGMRYLTRHRLQPGHHRHPGWSHPDPRSSLAGCSPTEEQTRDIHPSQCHRKSGSIFVAMVGANHGIVTMSADHAFRGIGDHQVMRWE